MSRSPSPMNTPSPVYSESSESEAAEEEEEKGEEDTATCLWGECGKVFTHLPFADRAYPCRKSRLCVPCQECDKSFTRNDALAKHLRHQHKQSPPAPGRGGSRKRKRNPDDIEVAPRVSTRSQTPTLGTFSLFDLPVLGGRSPSWEDNEGYKSSGSSSDVIPPHLMAHLDSGTGRIFGRNPEQVLYLLAKAKLRYAQEQNEALQEELRVTRAGMRREREGKERAVNHVLRGLFGVKVEGFLVATDCR
ncbi:hypothetical protein EV421DRAFT_1739578 [Armillaria borealis]|uniref:C2H2-type domain-containing protein n=1 Tax=Armillaria borealis TaxID=47425 RepID=A0AA39MJ82_9AGAR|nr:hypothetical protein EV421DRAFT_1739578 [Armillaria borealis]